WGAHITSRSTADDGSGGSPPCCALPYWSITGREHAATDCNDRANRENCRSHNLLLVCDIAQRSPADIADPPQFSLLSVEPVLGINKDLLRMHVEHQPAAV